ncbi:MAG: CGNR zinc finger domain-containing protein [Gammaproteobacteria bacterium]
MNTASRFPLLGEPLAVDLVNTRIRMGDGDVDLLNRAAALAAWLIAERARLAWTGRVLAADLARVCALREAVSELLRARLRRRTPAPDAIRAVNTALAISAPAAQLVWSAAGPAKVAMDASLNVKALLHRLALDALEVLTGPQARHLRKCANPDCVLLFVAANPRRRWCSDALCGNRMRVSRHYQRARGAR